MSSSSTPPPPHAADDDQEWLADPAWDDAPRPHDWASYKQWRREQGAPLDSEPEGDDYMRYRFAKGREGYYVTPEEGIEIVKRVSARLGLGDE